MASPLPAARPDRVFAHPDYALFWASRFASTLGVMVEGVTLGWQVYDVARHTMTVAESAFMVGMIGLAQFLPLFALTLVAGAVADHFDRKKIYMACLASEVVCVGVLIWISHMAQPPLWGIFAIAVLFGAIRSFQSPAMSALAPMLVPRALLPRAIALGSLAWQTGAILGPWLGGVLVATSSATAYAAAGGLYVISALAMSQIRASTQPQRQGGGRVAMVREGLDYVWANKIVLGAISLDLVAVLLGGATALLPVYARDILHVGAGGFGVLRSGPAIGACVCAFVLGRRPLTRRAGLWMFGAVALFGLATIVFALSRVMALSVLALAVLGGHDQRVRPPDPGPDHHAGRHARTGGGGLQRVHRCLQRAGGVRERRGGAASRPGGRGPVRRSRIGDRHGALVQTLSDAAEGGSTAGPAPCRRLTRLPVHP